MFASETKSAKTIRIGGVAFDLKLTLSIVLATILPILHYYNHGPFRSNAYDQLLFFFVVPVLVVLFVFREWPQAYGLAFGKWREGLLWSLGACVVLGVILWFVARRPEMARWYRGRDQQSVVYLIWISGVEMFAWEYIWRGFFLFALARVVGPGPAIFLQAVPFAMLHLGKPEFETLTTIFGGACFGFVAWRCQSFLYSFLIHWFMLSFLVLAAAGRLG